MFPLYLAPTNKELIVTKVYGDEKLRKHLESLGISVGGIMTCLSENKGNLIIKIKEGRMAMNKELAAKIFARVQ